MTNRWVVITGAAGGVGQALVNAFSAAKYRVIAADMISKPSALQCDKYVKVDLAHTVLNDKRAKKIFDEITERIGNGHLNALINNAAVQTLGGIEELGLSAWRTSLDVNVLAPFFWSRAMVPLLQSSGGSIVNVTSIHGKITKKGFLAYSTSKAALDGLTRGMAIELEGRVRVNAIAPGAVETKMLLRGFRNDPKKLKTLRTFHPTNRLGYPEEIASLVLDVVSDKYRFLNGTTINIDGGISARLHDPE